MNQLEPGIRGYTHWREALWSDERLREIARERHRDPRVTAEIIALRGANGRGCVIGTAKVSARTGYDRHTVGEHRRLLVDLGWLTVRGKSGRCPVVDISLPVGVSNAPIAPPVGGSGLSIGVSNAPLSDSTYSDKDVTYDPWTEMSTDTNAASQAGRSASVEVPGGTSPSAASERSEHWGTPEVGALHPPIGDGCDSGLDELRERWRAKREDRDDSGSGSNWRERLSG